MKTRTQFYFLLFLPLFFLFTGCSTDDGSDYEDPAEKWVTLVFTNESDQEIHMWAVNETMGAGNKLAPYGVREAKFYFAWLPGEWLNKETFTISAGRNGTVLYSVSDGFDSYEMPRNMSAIWDGTRIIWSYTKK